MSTVLNDSKDNTSSSNNTNNNNLIINQFQQMALFGQMPMMSTMNPVSILNSEQFPDILQHMSTEHCKALFTTLAEMNNPTLVNKKGPMGGYSALAWMCIKNEIELIEFLILKCKADVNSKATLGETPLFICIKNCNIYTIELLIEHGADLTARDNYNRSLIHWSAYTGKIILFYYFQKYHSISNINDIDSFQQNALHIASASGFSELVRYLIDSGDINLFAQDINGNTCMHMAVKSGMSRTCWLIAQKNRGECIRLINMENKQKQKPYDLIRNEKGLQFKKIRDWLRLEAKTNDLLEKNPDTTVYEKKSDDFMIPSKFPTKKLCSLLPANYLFKWNSHRAAYFEWYARITGFFIILTIPQILNRVLFDKNDLNLFRGVFAYAALACILFSLTKQKHRINHICGWENPFYLGYFLALVIHNYTSFYFVVLQSFNVIKITDLVSVLLTSAHLYSFYALIIANPGFVRENLKKGDGSSYDLRDLLKTNYKERSKTTKDSLNWLTEPSSNTSLYFRPYFCESCLIVASSPTKHCKLCEGCCSKFDHHCLFINKCVGLKNHRPFMWFLIFTITCTVYYLYNVYCYFVQFNERLYVKNMLKNPSERCSFLYYTFASTNHLWLTNLFLMNIFTVLMVTFLLYFQMKFVTLGFTSQFQPPPMFNLTSKKMSNITQAICHRFQNMYIFFFKSFECNEELYYQQINDYNYSTNLSKAIPLSLYPRNDSDQNQFLSNYPMNGAINTSNANGNSNSKSQFEIQLD